VDFGTIFGELKRILVQHDKKLVCSSDDMECYSLNTRHIMKNGKPLFFGSVQINKNYVSYHLMPVYVEPSLLVSVSVELRKHMHGKSCFNFKSIDAEQLSEIQELTQAGYHYYESKDYI